MSDRFLFVGDALALDLVDTEAVIRRRSVDLIAPPGAYAAWWGEVASRYPELVARLAASDRRARPELLGAVVELRAALRVLFGAVADGVDLPREALEVLNRALGMIHDNVAVAQDGTPVPMLSREGPELDGPMLVIARSAFELLTEAEPGRIHRCANPRCVMIFYDTTKSATRRWCSLGCRNRYRSSARYVAKKDAVTG